MNILLISTYDLGHQPLGLASPAAALLEEGFGVECLDLAVQPFDETVVRKADFVGLSVPMHTALRLGVAAASRVRTVNPGAHVCFYGLYASLNAGFLLRSAADSVIGGEFEEPLVNMARWLRAGAGPAPGNGPAGPPLPIGISTRTMTSEPFLGRATYRLPARRLLPPLSKYARLDTGDELKLAGCVEASHGCAHECLHCPITPVYRGRFRIVPESLVIEDAHQLYGMGARHITFGDPDFLNGVRHSLGVARRLHDELPNVTFDVTAKIEHILEYREVVKELAGLGCVFIVSAAEVMNDRILGYLEKGHTGAEIREAFRVARDAGLPIRPSWMPFTPWTSIGDYVEILDFIQSNDLEYHVDPVQLSIRLLLPPGSSLLRRPELAPHLGPLDAEGFTYTWMHPDPRMDELQLEAGRLVEQAMRSHEEPPDTIKRLRDLVARMWPEARREGRAGAGKRPFRPPRLTEAWFC
jgi:radical SAM superfamily enzyme YgiQ (UPF0313 family)